MKLKESTLSKNQKNWFIEKYYLKKYDGDGSVKPRIIPGITPGYSMIPGTNIPIHKDAFKKEDNKPTWNEKVGNTLSDAGTKLLHGITTLGGSVIGDVIKDVSPKAANWLDRHTWGMITTTPEDKLIGNRSSDNNKWVNRGVSAVDAINSAMIAGTFSKVIEKVGVAASRFVKTKGFDIKLNKIINKNNLTDHIQGDDAVKMFKEYGGLEAPKNSGLYKRLKEYAPEARERYGLVGETRITDDEIANSVYKRMIELQKQTGSANITSSGEPRVLFRGDTRRYDQLKTRPTPTELAEMSGTMDNSLGNLFLGDLPRPNRGKGIDQYITTQETGAFRNLNNSTTGSRIIKGVSEVPESELRHLVTTTGVRGNTQPYSINKVPAKYNESGVNDINAFFINTKAVRPASTEISVLEDGILTKYSKDFKGNNKQAMLDYDGPDSGIEFKRWFSEHYENLLNDAANKNQGLLKSDKSIPEALGGKFIRRNFRGEHQYYDYFALPNFNINGAKHILPYDLRMKTDFKNPNIYKSIISGILGGSTLLNKTNKADTE